MDPSSLEGFRVNNGIAKEDCSFHYASVDLGVDLGVEQIKRLAPGTLMAKAYRNILHKSRMAARSIHGQGPSIWPAQY